MIRADAEEMAKAVEAIKEDALKAEQGQVAAGTRVRRSTRILIERSKQINRDVIQARRAKMAEKANRRGSENPS